MHVHVRVEPRQACLFCGAAAVADSRPRVGLELSSGWWLVAVLGARVLWLRAPGCVCPPAPHLHAAPLLRRLASHLARKKKPTCRGTGSHEWHLKLRARCFSTPALLTKSCPPRALAAATHRRYTLGTAHGQSPTRPLLLMLIWPAMQNPLGDRPSPLPGAHAQMPKRLARELETTAVSEFSGAHQAFRICAPIFSNFFRGHFTNGAVALLRVVAA